MTEEERQKIWSELFLTHQKKLQEIINAKPFKEIGEAFDKAFKASQEIEGKLKEYRLNYKASLAHELQKIDSNIPECQLYLLRQKKILQDMIHGFKEEGDGYNGNNIQKMLIEIVEPEIEFYNELAKLNLPVPIISQKQSVPVEIPHAAVENIIISDKHVHSKPANDSASQKPDIIDLKWQSSEAARKVIDHLIEIRRFDVADRNLLLFAFYDEKFTRKILWHGAKNLLGTVIFDLRANNIIKAERRVMATWIEKYFKALGEYDAVESISYKYAYSLLGKSETARRVKKSHPDYIDIIAALAI